MLLSLIMFSRFCGHCSFLRASTDSRTRTDTNRLETWCAAITLCPHGMGNEGIEPPSTGCRPVVLAVAPIAQKLFVCQLLLCWLVVILWTDGGSNPDHRVASPVFFQLNYQPNVLFVRASTDSRTRTDTNRLETCGAAITPCPQIYRISHDGAESLPYFRPGHN